MTLPFYKAMLKNEYARKIGVSGRTLRRYLNERYFEELKEMNYFPEQKFLTPRQIGFLNKKLVFVDDPYIS
ncbi:MAG TPA: hypothetical protein DGC94_03840 [Prolixibacteraceae bacterium]|nr:hypothetical protein [Prolixibacteraceae bacterium]